VQADQPGLGLIGGEFTGAWFGKGLFMIVSVHCRTIQGHHWNSHCLRAVQTEAGKTGGSKVDINDDTLNAEVIVSERQ
jgi:hypothetical protein